MTRQECEDKILEKVLKIKAIYEEYNPNADYLSITLFKNMCWFNNDCRDKDKNFPIDKDHFFKEVE